MRPTRHFAGALQPLPGEHLGFPLVAALCGTLPVLRGSEALHRPDACAAGAGGGGSGTADAAHELREAAAAVDRLTGNLLPPLSPQLWRPSDAGAGAASLPPGWLAMRAA